LQNLELFLIEILTQPVNFIYLQNDIRKLFWGQ
jgi:hypothetical protein